MTMNIGKINVSENLRFQYIEQAASIHSAMHYFKLNPSTDEKGKLIDALILKRLEEIRNSLLAQGIRDIKDVTNLNDEDIRKLFENNTI